MLRSVVIGCGAYVPERVITNEMLSRRLDTSDEWITQRTGIKQRHVVQEGQSTVDLGILAARGALERAQISVEDLDVIICATSTADDVFPSTATQIQAGLGMHHGAAYDIQAVCSGFIYALTMADYTIRAGGARRVMVVGAETFSKIVDWTDRSTCILFGDGSGAVILEGQEGSGLSSDRGVLASALRSDGVHRDKLFVEGGAGSSLQKGKVRMVGKDVFKFAVNEMTEVVESVFCQAGLSIEEIDWFIPHQANERIILAAAKKLGISKSKIVMTLQNYANTSAASIPLALEVAERDGRLKKGDVVFTEAIGGGFTWGAALLRW